MPRSAKLTLQIVPGPAYIDRHRVKSGSSRRLGACSFRHDDPQDDVENDPDALHKSQQDKSDADP
jgi:hypothetical protein